MSTTRGPVDRINIGIEIAVLAVLTGCVGYVDGGYSGAVVVREPDTFVFGGGFERGREVHDYSHRGFESRRVAHPTREREEHRR